MTDAATPGREPLQLLCLRQPVCANTFGVAPCTATGTGDEKCYNTRRTCRDVPNFRIGPEDTFTPTLVKSQGDVVLGTELTRTVSLWAAFDVTFAAVPSGVIWEQGTAGARAAYLGITAGLLVMRAGGVSAASSLARLAIPAAPFAGLTRTLFVEIGTAGNSVRLWSFDAATRLLTDHGTGISTDGFPAGLWCGAGAGKIGDTNGSVATGEDGGPWNGAIAGARFYDGSVAPNLNVTLPLWFSRGGVAAQRIVPYQFPALASVSTAPARINLAGANPDAQGLGNRAVCQAVLADFQHTDRLVDPYVAGRSWNPLDAARGTFWSRWLARNPYRQNMQLVVYDGYAGQAPEQMVQRTYFLQSAQLSGGQLTLEGKDILTRIEERKAQAPLASPGVLWTDISDSATGFEVTNAVEADYAAAGTLRIADEVMTYTGRATSSNGVAFTGVTRGTDGTTAEEHSVEDGVQQCLRFAAAPFEEVCETLLADYGGVDRPWLDLAGWAAEAANYLSFYRLTGLVTEPTGVQELQSDIQIQALAHLWWDERVAKVKLKAVRGIDEEPDLLTDAGHILADSFHITEKPRERASQVWVYWGQRDPTRDVDDAANYVAASIVADLESEGAAKYGEPSIRKIFGRFLPSAALADTTASKISTRYRETPSEAGFRLDARDGAYWLGDTVRISHWRDVDPFGARRIRYWTIVSAGEVVPGEIVEYLAEDTTLSGRISYIMAGGAADYDPGNVPFKSAYIGNAAGLLSDGEPCARIN